MGQIFLVFLMWMSFFVAVGFLVFGFGSFFLHTASAGIESWKTLENHNKLARTCRYVSAGSVGAVGELGASRGLGADKPGWAFG